MPHFPYYENEVIMRVKCRVDYVVVQNFENITYAFLCKYLLLLELMSTTYYSSLPLFYTSIGIMKVKLPQALFP